MEEGPSHWTKEMMRDRKCLMTGWCGKPPQRFKICRTPKWPPLFVKTHRSCCSEQNWMFFHVPYSCTMFLSVAGSDFKCAVLCGKITHRHSLHCFLMVSLDTDLGVAYSCQPIILCLFHWLSCRSLPKQCLKSWAKRWLCSHILDCHWNNLL